ncbi:MAG: site-2 protease family protein [Bythopirellula sp.]|nr:site-2 protease family protein [Bythopirellula sp.]
MGICLIAAIDLALWWNYLLMGLLVMMGLGAVIFVHELGHFAVAKMCGVKCEKFFIGFDIGGYKLSRKWGETEYGIGILPLGGYVKMLGQDDNPANIAEQVRESQVQEGSPVQTKEIVGPDGTKYVVDSRSYLAKSVPQRMAIISAGVIMNVIFAFIFAVIAYGIGVPYNPCVVSETSPGSAAYQAGLRTGDEITKIGEIEKPTFTDLKTGVTLGDLENGIPFTVRRAATGKEETVVLKPRQEAGGLAKVGIFSPHSLRLNVEFPVAEGSSAAEASPKFEGNDDIIAVNGEPVSGYHEFVAQIVEHVGEPLEVTVQRGGKAPSDDPFGLRKGGEELTIKVPAKPTRSLGLVMEMGKIVAVEQGTEAADKQIAPGDFIDKVSYAGGDAQQVAEGEQLFSDPMTLPEQLRRLAEENRDIELTVRRSAASGDGRQATEPLRLRLRKVTWLEPTVVLNDPLSVPALGIAYRVLNRVNQVIPESPAALAGMKSGDVVTQVEFDPALEKKGFPKKISFNEQGGHNWPVFMQSLQNLPADAKIKLTYQRGDETLTAELTPQVVPGSFEPELGFQFDPIRDIRRASSFGEQIELGYRETVNSLGMVFRFLQKLGTGQVPATALGGPFTIAGAAWYSAFAGMGSLLVFLTMLSANLAVINFLPIPLLDGGHMVFLAWEGLRGRPAGERFVVALHTIGFVFIVSLMLFVLSLDLGLIDRNL